MEHLGWSEIETRAAIFSKRCKQYEGKERQEAPTFEKEFMDVFGVDWREGHHEYPLTDLEGHLCYVDYFLPSKIIIEMKSKGESLTRAYNQAYNYYRALKPEEQPELIMTCDFENIEVKNMRTGHMYKRFKVSNLKKHVRMFGKLAGYDNETNFETDIEVNTKASYKLAKLHDELKKNGYKGHQLEVYLVRLLFCLFAEDTGIFEKHAFKDYIEASKEDGSDLSSRIMQLFFTLDTPKNKRVHNLPDELKKFRYINGGVFSETIAPAYFDNSMRHLLLDCCDFDWNYISPAIFGAMFQGVMDPKQRRELGVHYTSEENIMKVIKPLFLDALWMEFDSSKNTKKEMEAFYQKICSLQFLDPSCGCGNFLIIAYRELRLLEFEIQKHLNDYHQIVFTEIIDHISINQFHGIEYEEFPCQVAQVGLLLMKHQMDQEASHYFNYSKIDFPIREQGDIVHGNALRIDWKEKFGKVDYIFGNPPFIGKKEKSKEQKEDLEFVFGKNFKGLGQLDYVTAWHLKSSKYLNSYELITKCAFVSTNSICQGEQVPILWKYLINDLGMKINFAYKTFVWNNEAKGKAHVHCVIIGFSKFDSKNKVIYDNDKSTKANNINPYLIDSNNVFIKKRGKPISNVSEMNYGSIPYDKGNLILSEEEKVHFTTQEPYTNEFIRPYVGGDEMLNNKKRYCLWLKGFSFSDIKKSKLTMERIKLTKQFRENSDRAATKILSSSSHLFGEIRQPETEYLMIPKVSSEKRKYIPIKIMDKSIIANGSSLIIPNATLYEFGVLTSYMHMLWMKTVAGRMKSDYQYSASIVYNNFIFPTPTDKQKAEIEICAQAVLNARNQFLNSSLSDLYGEFMDPLLIKAHDKLDKAVEKAYGRKFKNDDDRLRHLFQLYEKLTKE